MNKFYITTSIPYANAQGHIGHALEFVQADVVARYHRAKRENVFFLTGTDEHGIKIAKAAADKGVNPQDFTDQISARFGELTRVLNISNDDFIRTTDQKRHWPAVKEVWQKLGANGDLYKKQYEGLYCSGCEAFITEKELADGRCAIHKKAPEKVAEENWFFKLSKYESQIKEKIEGGELRIVPEGRKNEVLSLINQGLQDVSFSRPKEKLQWGIPVPGDETSVIYVWADALVNYISALGYSGGEKFKKYWPADVHVVGKDILRFHGTIWPAMLLSLGIALPKTIFVHGYITVDGQKISKSLGNVIDPFELVQKYGADAVRYFLLREIPPTEDGDFSYEKFETRYNADLANNLGNQLKRVLDLAIKYGVSLEIPEKDAVLECWRERRLFDALENFEFSKALELLWRGIPVEEKGDEVRFVDSASVVGLSGLSSSIEANRPFDPMIDEAKRKQDTHNHLVELWRIAVALELFLPETAERIQRQIQERKSEILFPRIP